MSPTTDSFKLQKENIASFNHQPNMLVKIICEHLEKQAVFSKWSFETTASQTINCPSAQPSWNFTKKVFKFKKLKEQNFALQKLSSTLRFS